MGGGRGGGELWNYRPILNWKVAEVFKMHRKYGIKPNPLYSQGMGRVGCMPCIHANKNEMLEIGTKFPEEVARVAKWESLVRKVSKTGSATFFAMDKTGGGRGQSTLDATEENYGIVAVIEWAKTGRGGKQFDMFQSQTQTRRCAPASTGFANDAVVRPQSTPCCSSSNPASPTSPRDSSPGEAAPDPQAEDQGGRDG